MLRRLFTGNDPLIDIPDLFGYVIVFMITWLCWTSYQRASEFAIEAKQEAVVMLQGEPSLAVKGESARSMLASDHVERTDGSALEISKKQSKNIKTESIVSIARTKVENLTSAISSTSPTEVVNEINHSMNKFIQNLSGSRPSVLESAKPSKKVPIEREQTRDRLSHL